jgi:hypothetical protein
MTISGDTWQTAVTALAAVAAYAAGRAQAAGARLGPVEAVRRQHQRDAYAAFLKVANDFEKETRYSTLAWASQRDNNQGLDSTALDHEVIRRCTTASDTALVRINEAVPVVALEGPDEITRPVDAVVDAAYELMGRAEVLLRAIERNDALGNVEAELNACSQKLRAATGAFTWMARGYLNGEKRRRPWL